MNQARDDVIEAIAYTRAYIGFVRDRASFGRIARPPDEEGLRLLEILHKHAADIIFETTEKKEKP